MLNMNNTQTCAFRGEGAVSPALAYHGPQLDYVGRHAGVYIPGSLAENVIGYDVQVGHALKSCQSVLA